MAQRRTNIAVVLAGGSGSRFGAETNKVLVEIGGRPVLAYSLDTFERSDMVDAVVVVARPDDRPVVEHIIHAVDARKVAAIVPGGDTRQRSEWAGIRAAAALGHRDPLVLLHDAARPFMTLDLLDRVLSAAGPGGAIPAMPIPDAVIDADGRLVPAATLVRVQTPQVFALRELLETYPVAEAAGFSGVDTAETLQTFGDVDVRWVIGDADNIKVTVPGDEARAAELAPRFRSGRWAPSD